MILCLMFPVIVKTETRGSCSHRVSTSSLISGLFLSLLSKVYLSNRKFIYFLFALSKLNLMFNCVFYLFKGLFYQIKLNLNTNIVQNKFKYKIKLFKKIKTKNIFVLLKTTQNLVIIMKESEMQSPFSARWKNTLNFLCYKKTCLSHYMNTHPIQTKDNISYFFFVFESITYPRFYIFWFSSPVKLKIYFGSTNGLYASTAYIFFLRHLET